MLIQEIETLYIFGDNDEAFFIEADDGRVGISTNTPLAGTALTVAGTMKVTSGNDICIDGNCLSAAGTGSGDITEVNTNATTSGLSGGST